MKSNLLNRFLARAEKPSSVFLAANKILMKLNTVMLVAVLSISSTKAAIIDFTFEASVNTLGNSLSVLPHPIDFGTPISASLRVDYAGTPDTMSLISAHMTFGERIYTTTMASSFSLLWVVNDEPLNPLGPRDHFLIRIDNLIGPDVLSYSPQHMTFFFEDLSEMMFASETPSVDEFLAMPEFGSTNLSLFWDDGLPGALTNGSASGSVASFTNVNLSHVSSPSGMIILIIFAAFLLLFHRRNKLGSPMVELGSKGSKNLTL